MGRSYEDARRLGLSVEQPPLPPGWPTAEGAAEARTELDARMGRGEKAVAKAEAPTPKSQGADGFSGFDDLAVGIEELHRLAQAAKAPKGPTLALTGVLTEVQQDKEKRAFAGRAARASGERWERSLEALHAWYVQTGRAFISRLETPIRRTSASKKGSFSAVYLARAGVDFVGAAVVGDELAPVALEVKTSTDVRLSLDQVNEQQATQLGWYAGRGCLALVLVRLPSGWWLVPWQRWHGAPGSRRAKSLTAEDLDVVGVLCRLRPELHNAPDWLAAAGALDI